MALTVLEPGLHSIVVDGGRPAFRHLGMPLGGAADRAAYELGNALLGNEPTAPALEITMAGPTLQADQRTACVLFGSPFLAAIANKGRLPPGTTFTLEAGDVLKIGGTPTGVRGSLCVAGGFDDDFVNLGRLKANQGNQNYNLPADTDFTRFASVVIWCDRFNSAFGAGDLIVA